MENNVKRNLATNIAGLRQSAGMSQMQFAEKMDYTDKAISKWERCESTPDISVIKKIADFFEVSVDWLIEDHGDNAAINELYNKRIKRKNHIFIALVSIAAVWLASVIAFVIINGTGGDRAWLAFIWGAPGSLVTALVFNAIWGRYRDNYLYGSLLLWTLLGAIYITIGAWDFWYIFLFGLPIQIGILFGSQIKKIFTKKQ